MSLQNFIRTVWAANIEQSLRKALVAAATANTSYEGSLLNMGDKVRILQISDPTITAYTRTATITPENLDDAALELVADQAYYFAFKAHDVDAIQAKPQVLAQTTDKAAYGFADKVDTYLLGLYAAAGLTCYATGTTNWGVTSLNVEDVLLAAKEKAKGANWPEAGRFMIVPPWFETKLLLAGLVTKTVNDLVYANGLIDRILGWDILTSNNAHITTPSTGANTHIICGLRGETFGFAGVINKVEAFRPEAGFDDAVKGLYVFGGKIIRPDKAMTIYADKTAEA